MIRPAAFAVFACCALALSACGIDRRQPGVVRAKPSKQTLDVRVARAGLSVDLPQNADLDRPKKGATVLRASFGDAAVSVFAYRRTEQLPRNDRDLAAARRRLVNTVEQRDSGYRLIASRPTEVAGNRALELNGQQTFSRTRIRIRSLHVFKGSAEYVVEIAAPPGEFGRFDRTVGRRVEDSLQVTGTVRGA